MKIQSAKAGIGTGRAGLQAASGLFSSAGLFQKGVKTFHPNDLDPYLNFDTGDSMLNDSLETASFLEPVPVLRNLARGSNKGGDAEQDVALNQPKALPLIDGDGYLYLSGVSGNNARIADSDSLTFLNDIEIIVNFKVLDDSTWRTLVSKYSSTSKEYLLTISSNTKIQVYRGGGGGSAVYVEFNTSYDDLKPWIKATHRLSDGQCQLFFSDDGVTWSLFDTLTMSAVTPANGTTDVFLGGFGNTGQADVCRGAIKRAIVKDGINGTSVLDVDFTAPNVRHGATKFKCATGQVVTINQDSSSSNDVATIIKKPVLRFDGVDDFMDGVFGQTITGGYMFAAFSVLGDGGSSHGRVFSLNSTGSDDSSGGGAIFSLKQALSSQLRNIFNGAYKHTHIGLFDDANGDILHESLITDAAQLSRVNNADEASSSEITTISAEEFNISARPAGTANAAIDLEYLALFPASITDEQADKIRNYINNRNNVFDLKDGFGYYFYNPQDLTSGAVTSWNGRIVGSDNGDTDKLATQTDANDQPVSDGYVVTFADNTDHLDIPSTTQAGWQVVGTSLGTFAYKVNANAVTELNLLGNLGNASYRKTGDLYGVILLPESATGHDINEAKKLLTDRGASVSATGTVADAWRNRADIVQFDGGDMSDVTSAGVAWYNCSSLTSFSTELPSATTASYAWYGCSSLESFSSELPLVTNVIAAWHVCPSLTSFSTPLPSATTAYQAWRGCSSLTDFSADVFADWNPSGITSGIFDLTWDGCTSLTAQSVENILVSIVASGKYATSTGASGGPALADAGIDIDYNGDPLSAATTAAITSLKSKGWSIFINSVEQ